MDEAAQRSITTVGNIQLPKPTDNILLVMAETAVGEHIYETSPTAEKLSAALRQNFNNLEVLAFPRDYPLSVISALEKAAPKTDFLIYASTSRGTISEEEQALAQRIFALDKPALHLALWNPYHILKFDQPALVSYGFRGPSLEALASVLAGQPALGKLPFEV